MASTETTAPITGLGLICVGAVATAVGGLGVGFRAAGLGYLGQSLAALVLGVAMLTVGLHVAAQTRRSVFASLRRPPAQRFSPPAPTPMAHRVRVQVWATPLALPPARQR